MYDPTQECYKAGKWKLMQKFAKKGFYVKTNLPLKLLFSFDSFEIIVYFFWSIFKINRSL